MRANGGRNEIDVGAVRDGRVVFPNWRGPEDRPAVPPQTFQPPAERVGFAIVGLGRLALEEIMPAFGEASRARLVAVMSGSPEKAQVVGRQYGIAPARIFGMDDWDKLAADPAIGAVYIVTPNALHREHVIAAAQAGKHVLCEKPMATSSAEARDMVEACRRAGVRLMIAYRCQYEPFNRAATALARSGDWGPIRLIDAVNTQVQGPAEQWRHDPTMAGGGALPDIGLYCLNAARATTGEEPVEVFARVTGEDPRFRGMDETISFMLRFPSGTMANCASSYTAHESKDMRVHLQGAFITCANAFAYRGQALAVARRQGDGESVEMPRIAHKNQFTLEIDHFAACLQTGRAPRTPGEEGVQDHVLMEAIYESARDGRPVSLDAVAGLDPFRGPPLDGG